MARSVAVCEQQLNAVIMLTQVNATVEKVLSLQEGADDYLCKPFDPHELVARMGAVLRRGKVPRAETSGPGRPLQSGDLILTGTYRVRKGELVELTPKALALLEYLMLHPDEVLPRPVVGRRLGLIPRCDPRGGWPWPRYGILRDDPDHSLIETVVGGVPVYGQWSRPMVFLCETTVLRPGCLAALPFLLNLVVALAPRWGCL